MRIMNQRSTTSAPSKTVLILLFLVCSDSNITEAWTPSHNQSQQGPLSPPRATTLAPQQWGGITTTSTSWSSRLSLPLVGGRFPTLLVGTQQQQQQRLQDKVALEEEEEEQAWIQEEIKSSLQQQQQQAVVQSHRSLNVAQVFQIAIPAVAVGLCWPVLSMQDTAACGRAVGTVAQAALHPAIAVLNYASKLLVRLRQNVVVCFVCTRATRRHFLLEFISLNFISLLLPIHGE